MGWTYGIVFAMLGAAAFGFIQLATWIITGAWPPFGYELWQNRIGIVLIIGGAIIGFFTPE